MEKEPVTAPLASNHVVFWFVLVIESDPQLLDAFALAADT